MHGHKKKWLTLLNVLCFDLSFYLLVEIILLLNGQLILISLSEYVYMYKISIDMKFKTIEAGVKIII